MANYTNMELLRFLLFEVHPVQTLFQYERYAHLDAESGSDDCRVDQIIGRPRNVSLLKSNGRKSSPI